MSVLDDGDSEYEVKMRRYNRVLSVLLPVWLLLAVAQAVLSSGVLGGCVQVEPVNAEAAELSVTEMCAKKCAPSTLSRQRLVQREHVTELIIAHGCGERGARSYVDCINYAVDYADAVLARLDVLRVEGGECVCAVAP